MVAFPLSFLRFRWLFTRKKEDLFIKEALHLMDSAVIEGNISAKTMIVEEGARYNGSCKIGELVAPAKN